jgi:hypothetical protein
MKNASYFICGNRAYRSEPNLYKHERITAERCMVVKAPAGLRQIHLLEGARGGMTAWSDGMKALKAMQKRNAVHLISIAVL